MENCNVQIETTDKVKQAVRFIKAIASQHNCALAFSGGKDSVILNFLAKEAGVKVDLFYNNTTIDPPGTISFCKKQGCKIVRGRFSFLELVEKRGFPTMFRRFCCKELKERYYADYVFFGIRKGESVKRDNCYSDFDDIYYYTKKIFTNRFFPMLFFTDDDERELVQEHSIEMHPLYYDECGQFDVTKRLGCIGCPLKSDRGRSDFYHYPILLKQVLRRGIIFHMRHNRTADDAALNLVHNLFYSNHGYEKFRQTFCGLFPNDPWAILSKHYKINREDVLSHLPKPDT